jgi:hypothetical protein
LLISCFFSGSNTPASNTPTEAPKRTHGMDRLRSFLGMSADQPKLESNRLHQQAKESAAAYDPSSGFDSVFSMYICLI